MSLEQANGMDDDDARALVAKASRYEAPTHELAQARVWNRLRRREERDRRRPAWAMFAAGLGCAALATLAWVTLRPVDARLTALLLRSDGAQVKLHAGDRVRGDGALSVLELPDNAAMVLGADADLRVDRYDATGVVLSLSRGSLLAHVVSRRGREPLVVRMPKMSARVIGTVFRALVQADGASSLAVGHGAVEVDADGHARTVRSGEIWPVGSPDRPDPRELARLGADELEGVSAASFAPAPRALECPSEPSLAIACQLALASAADGIRAENALYEAGSIAFHALHDPNRALEIWEGLQIRFPGGVLAAEAQASIIDALVALHRSSAAEREIERYLRAHPAGLRAPEMHYVLATLERSQDGDCRRAARELTLALANAAEPWAAHARAVCLHAP